MHKLVASVCRASGCRQQQVDVDALAMEIEDAACASVRSVVSCAVDEPDKALTDVDWLLVLVDDQLQASSTMHYHSVYVHWSRSTKLIDTGPG